LNRQSRDRPGATVTAAPATVADSQTAPAPVEITPQPNETNELADDSAPKEITPRSWMTVTEWHDPPDGVGIGRRQ